MKKEQLRPVNQNAVINLFCRVRTQLELLQLRFLATSFGKFIDARCGGMHCWRHKTILGRGNSNGFTKSLFFFKKIGFKTKTLSKFTFKKSRKKKHFSCHVNSM